VTFNDVLSQTIAMLHQHGRFSYRALRWPFGIDDAYLADLTDAILFAHPDILDEVGRGLVWTGEAGPASATTVGLAMHAGNMPWACYALTVYMAHRDTRR
jgi:hypothetical protein